MTDKGNFLRNYTVSTQEEDAAFKVAMSPNGIHVLMIESSFLDSFEEAVIVQDNSLKGKSVKVGSTLGQIESKNKPVYELKCPVEGHLEEFGDCKQVQYFCLIKTNRK